MSIRLGYACINLSLGNKVLTSRTATRKTIQSMRREDAVVYLKELALSNLRDLQTILEWNVAHGILFFRITSNLFPHMGDRELVAWYPETTYFRGDIRFALKALGHIGEYARKHGIRLTFHSNPYCQIAAIDRDVLRATMADLVLYTKILHALGATDRGRGGCLILHGGGHYGDKAVALARLESRIAKLPRDIKSIIALENDERMYGVSDLLPMCERLGVYFCLDVFHNEVSTEENRVKLTRDIILRTCRTWTARGEIPKFHLSQQARGDRLGAHSANITEIPRWMFRIAQEAKLESVDLMLESKNKDLSVLKLFKLHTTLGRAASRIAKASGTSQKST